MFEPEIVKTYNDLDRTVYNYVINNIHKVTLMRIRDLSEFTHVSTTSILRFCKKNECNGFSEFKYKLKQYITQQEEIQLYHYNDVHEHIDFLKKAQSEHFNQAITDICQVIATTQNVLLIGIGTSGIMAEYGARFFSTLGMLSHFINDPYMPVYNYDRESTVILISNSGETTELINIAQAFKKSPSKVVSITNTANSTIAKMSDYNISTYINVDRQGSVNLASNISIMYILESLAKQTSDIRTSNQLKGERLR